MTEEDYQQLNDRVLAHRYQKQQTYLIDGTRYVLERDEMPSNGSVRWQLWIYPQDRFADFIGGDTIQEVFTRAAMEGIPIEKLTLDKWHD